MENNETEIEVVEETLPTLKEWIKTNGRRYGGIKLNAIKLPDPDRHAPRMPPGSSSWVCVLQFNERSMTFPFSMGSAHTKPPTPLDVLPCLLMDLGTLHLDFTDFCGDYGYDEDSLAARETYESCVRQGKDVEYVFGDALKRLFKVFSADNTY